ncbi:hypothetical protein [Salimicrobium album]|uniref:Uncharacterized protein n=1 Tax=Salimicrobium album TaxID=50717 RepID=A0A1H3DDZ4_9BACI|nr:hypothetical protein [Salimicrobium album]SDX64611.1 hypothetical protein SAMN04488081_0929 [Salimicrobium album]
MPNVTGDLTKAKELLRDTDKTVREIEEETGANPKTIYYHAKRIRDAAKEQNESNNELTESLQKTLKDSYDELKRYAAELEQDVAAKDKEIERLHAELTKETHTKTESALPDTSDWKGQHDDVLEKYEYAQIQLTRVEKHAEFDRKEAQDRIDNLLKQLRTEQQRADYHGKRDHYLTELLKLG